MTLLLPDPEAAAHLLLAGGLVGLPTETVYGLAGDAESPAAVARIYRVKGRPSDHPLIVHVSSAEALDPARGWAGAAPEYALRLADRLWPGPLTLVLPRGPRAGDHVTGAQATVGLRCPAHPLALAVLTAGDRHRTGGLGLAAPSANRFGRVSPTSAADVLAELAELLEPGRDGVLDGGDCPVGVESTIVDCTGDDPVLLRPGGIGPAEIERAGGRAMGVRPSSVRAPGMLASHYAPKARVRLLADGAALAEWAEAAGGELGPVGLPGPVGLLAPADVPTPAGLMRLAAPVDATAYAHELYRALRAADARGLRTVLVVPPRARKVAEGTELTELALIVAIDDRLRRAAT